MRKIFTLFILLLLLPVTALAAENDRHSSLYVGNTDVTKTVYPDNAAYWTSSDGGTTWTPQTDKPTADSYIHYDGNGTLTLNGATIKGGNSATEVPYGAGIHAFCGSGQSVSLTIELIGENTIKGSYGILVDAQQGNTEGIDASLIIKGDSGSESSLNVTGSSNYGISVISGTGDASLTIENTTVNASTSVGDVAGVCVRSGSQASNSPQLSLAVNGGSLTASGGVNNDGIQFYVGAPEATNATTSLIVSNNAIVRAENGIKAERVDKPTPSGTGIVFDGTEGTVYGEVILQEDLEIGEGETLTIPEGSSLDTNGKLTNNGTIIVKGELTGEVKGNGSIPITGITLDETELSLDVDGTYTLRAMITPEQATDEAVTWISNNTNIATVDENGTVTAVSVGIVTITVTTTDDSKTATCEVTVTHSDLKHFDRKEATCTERGNIEYWHCEGCDKYFSDAVGKSEINLAQTVINATGHKLTKTEAKEPTCTEAGNKEYWTCESCGSLFRDEVGSAEIKLEDVVIPATGHHYVNGTCTVCGEKDPDYRPDPISYYNIYVEDVCDGVEVIPNKRVVREGGSITVSVEKDTAHYTFDNFKIYYKRSYYGTWEELKEGVQPGEYPIRNIWTHIYIKAEGAEEKEDPTGIESIEGVKVYTKDGSLYVQTPQREQVIIVSMSGAVVKNEEQIGLKQYHGLQPGIYIVRVGDRAYKVRLN